MDDVNTGKSVELSAEKRAMVRIQEKSERSHSSAKETREHKKSFDREGRERSADGRDMVVPCARFVCRATARDAATIGTSATSGGDRCATTTSGDDRWCSSTCGGGTCSTTYTTSDSSGTRSHRTFRTVVFQRNLHGFFGRGK